MKKMAVLLIIALLLCGLGPFSATKAFAGPDEGKNHNEDGKKQKKTVMPKGESQGEPKISEPIEDIKDDEVQVPDDTPTKGTEQPKPNSAPKGK